MKENAIVGTPAQAQAGIARFTGQDCCAAAGSAQREPGERPAASLSKRIHPRKPFPEFRAVVDEQSEYTQPPKGAKLVWASGSAGGHFVPVSFVAKDWNVTARRIRALLAAGRLAGRVQENGYWEVRFPYLLTFGTRGPVLKRQQRQPDKPKNPELKAVQNEI
ncbi:MAG: hypothetical protein Q8O64_05610 [Sideroxyarcus sp.]|nr:hypothetical protein [Sideroxyarcus sp.]